MNRGVFFPAAALDNLLAGFKVGLVATPSGCSLWVIMRGKEQNQNGREFPLWLRGNESD